MTDKQKIKQEIERLKHTSNAYDRSRFMLLLEIEDFIDSLPEEPASEDLEKEIDRFEEWVNNFNQSDYPTSYTVRDIARHFAEWQKQQMMKNAVEAIVCKGLYSKYIKERDDEALSKILENFNSGERVKIIIVNGE